MEARILAGLRGTELGATVLVVAYRRATIALADEVVYVEQGRVVDRGRHEVLQERCAGYRALVTAFAQRVLKDADYSVLTDYISTETYLQHNPEAADGLDGFGAAAAGWAEQGKNLIYKTVHRVVAEGDLVLLQSEGEFGVPVAYWDLFRVEDGKIVEHWDVIAPIPAELPHGNGVF